MNQDNSREYISLGEYFTLKRVKILLLVIPAFLIFLSYVHLSIYYSPFDINIFSYLSVNTILLHTIKSLGLVTVISFFLATFLMVYDVFLYDKFRLIEKKLKSNKNIPKFSSWIFFIVAPIILFAPLIIYFFPNIFLSDKFIINNEPYRGFILIPTFVVGIILYFYSVYRYKIKSTFSSFLIILTLIITYFTIISATIDALYLEKNKRYKFIYGKDLKGSYPAKKHYKLIGKADNHYFLTTMENDYIIIKNHDDFKRLHFHNYNSLKIPSVF